MGTNEREKGAGGKLRVTGGEAEIRPCLGGTKIWVNCKMFKPISSHFVYRIANIESENV